LAISATITDGQPVDRADIVKDLRKLCRVEEFEGSESTSLERMRELGVTIGTARNDTFWQFFTVVLLL
jgi:hypothetical protein